MGGAFPSQASNLKFPVLRMRPVPAELVLLAASLFFVLVANSSFWSTFMKVERGGLLTVLAVGVVIGIVHWVMLLLVTPRALVKILLPILFFATAGAVYFMQQYKVYLDRTMMQNVLETDLGESLELLRSGHLLATMLGLGLLPSMAVCMLPLQTVGWRTAIARRTACVVCSLLVATLALWACAQELIPVFRERKELRYLITPSNYLVSSLRALAGAGEQEPVHARTVIAPDAVRAPFATQRKPIALVFVLGETARAANWGLNGYARQTTPGLAGRGVVNFPDVSSCGTSTAVSVPCIFSAYGRRQYDESRIRDSQSVLHVLARTGVSVLWRDNQAGCKGVCDGLPTEVMSGPRGEACQRETCLDGRLLEGLTQKIDAAKGDLVIVLHMMGSHGPAYSQRYPLAYEHWAPVCKTVNLSQCRVQDIVNGYDNSILYTDHVLSQAIDDLHGIASHDTALFYVSDHGESLGEDNLYLHGMPYAIAPEVQRKVPQIMWLSAGIRASLQVDESCLAAQAAKPTSHDSIFSMLLGLFDVRTKAYAKSLDPLAPCRGR